MGYERPVREMEVFFEEGDLAGIELRLLQNPDMRTYYDILGILFGAADDEDEDEDGAPGEAAPESPPRPKALPIIDRADKAMERARLFAERTLLGWNVEVNGEPVPATPEAFTAHLDALDALLVMGKWLNNVGRVAPPLVEQSDDGSTSEEPKESPSPESSSEPSS